MINKTTTSLFLLLVSIYIHSQDYKNYDPFYVDEHLPAAPEAAILGEFGNYTATPYNGKADIKVPIYTIDWEGLQVPIQLSYDSGGVKVAEEASWVGLNWNLSTNHGIYRRVYGSDDFSEISAEFFGGGSEDIKSGYIYNDILPDYSGFEPKMSFSDILSVHYSNNLPKTTYYGSRNLDTQPDVFTLNALGQSYKFIFKKKGSGNVLQTQVFNSNNAVITYNLNNQSFTLKDENGFTFLFTTKDYSTSFANSVPPVDSEGPWSFLYYTFHREEATMITSWLLDKVISPRGRELNFDYTAGMYFSFPFLRNQYKGKDEEPQINTMENPQREISLQPSSINLNTAVIENNYLSGITGDFGSVSFGLDDRVDLCTGRAINEFSNDFFRTTTMYTANLDIQSSHGTAAGLSLLPKRLSNITVKDPNSTTIIDAQFQHSYFNEDVSSDLIPERYLRLKLDGVSINNQNYQFSYIAPNELEAKDSYSVDFWGYANGIQNNVWSPRIGRFITSRILTSTEGIEQQGSSITVPIENYKIGQTFFMYKGARRKSNFNYGKTGLMNGIVYPTGGATEFIYEPHEIVRSVPKPFEATEYFNGSDRFRWTNMLDEDNFDITYQYLKCSKDPTYNFFEMETPTIQGDPITLPIGYGQEFEVEFPSLIRVEGSMTLQTGQDGLDFWSNYPLVVAENIQTGEQKTIFKVGDGPTQTGYNNTVSVNKDVNLVAGRWRIVNVPLTIPPGEDYSNYPPSPIMEYQSQQISLYTFDSLNQSDLAAFAETFEIGGARIKKIIHKNIDGTYLKGEEFSYDYPDGIAGIASSGVLMDDLIFHNKASGFHSYNPRGYRDFFLVGDNMVGNNNSAQGSHVGYSFTTQYKVDAEGNRLGRIEREYHNEKNEYFKDSFDLPYQFDAVWVDKDNDNEIDAYISNVSFVGGLIAGLFGYDSKNELLIQQPANYEDDILIRGSVNGWGCVESDCDAKNQVLSLSGNASVQNTVVLGLPLRLNFDYVNGSILKERIYDFGNRLEQKTENTYAYLNGNITLDHYSSFLNATINANYDDNNDGFIETRLAYVYQQGPWGANQHTNFSYEFPLHHGLVSKLSTNMITQYYDSGEFSNNQRTSYDLETHFPRMQTKSISQLEEDITKFYYPFDPEVSSKAYMNDLVLNNRLSTIVKIDNFKNEHRLSTIEYDFDKSEYTSDLTLISGVNTKKSDANQDARELYERYDTNRNLIQKRTAEGIPVSYIWGYNNRYVVAMLENVEYEDLTAYTTLIQLASNDDNDRTLGNSGKEGELRNLLSNLRSNFPEAMVTTYTYDPLIGVTSITDPRGYVMYYTYDEFNRLKEVKDELGNLIEDYKYEYSEEVFNGSFSDSPYTSPDPDGNIAPDRPLSVKILYGNSGATYQNFNASVTGGDADDYNYEWFLSTNSRGDTFFDNPSATTSSFSLDIRCDQYRYVKLVVTSGGDSDFDIKINKNAPCGPGDDPDEIE